MTGQLNAGLLYVVATPIGHLGDLSRRAEEVLKRVQILAAEDTRRTRVLLDHIEHRVPELVSLHEHNEAQMTKKLIERLLAGVDVAVVSDAGTPLINDPGYVFVRAAHAAGINLVPIPGPCAITTVLSVCPLPCHPFSFIGFLPAKATARRQLLENRMAEPDALVFLEAPHRILETLSDISLLTSRQVMIGRELTKKFETLLVGEPRALIDRLGEQPKGEFTVVIEAAAASTVTRDAQSVLRVLLQELPPSKAAKMASTNLRSKKIGDVYLGPRDIWGEILIS